MYSRFCLGAVISKIKCPPHIALCWALFNCVKKGGGGGGIYHFEAPVPLKKTGSCQCSEYTRSDALRFDKACYNIKLLVLCFLELCVASCSNFCMLHTKFPVTLC